MHIAIWRYPVFCIFFLASLIQSTPLNAEITRQNFASSTIQQVNRFHLANVTCQKSKKFLIFEKRAKRPVDKTSPYDYAVFADELDKSLVTENDKCGYTGQNVVFFVRQSLFDNTEYGDNALVFASDIATRKLFEFYQNGRHGFPIDQVLADCWWKAGSTNLRLCETLEEVRHGNVPQGQPPRGFKNLR